MFQFLPLGVILIYAFSIAFGIAPTIDLSHNMRILKLPQDTKVGSIIYRLRGSDPDNDILTFGVRGDAGKALLDIQSVSETRANVVLKASPLAKEYQLTIYVTDGSQTTEVESTIYITNATNLPNPFIEFNALITVSELLDDGEVIGTVVVRKRNSSSLPVLFEVEGSDRFAIKYVISPLKEASKAEISIVQRLDYEKQNLFQMTIFALNPWTNEDYDTRNVATIDFLVAVKDEQDTPPVFDPLPPVIRVSDSLSLGDNVTRIIAEDGDFGSQRNLSYSFVAGSPGLPFFNINARTGMITLAASTERLRESYSTSGPFVLNVQATEIETLERPGTPMSSEAHVAIVLVNTENRPPKFFNKRYVGIVMENSPELTSISWEGATMPKVMDDDQGKNGSFELFLEGDNSVFSVQPSRGMNELNFAILVKRPEGLDYERSDTKYIEFRIVARETASIRPLSATAEIRVKLTDANDNLPQFSHEVYNVTLPEDASPGYLLTKVQASDEDMGAYGIVRYTAVNGPIAGNLRLDPITGELTLLSGEGLDRERIPEYRLTVEARDDLGRGNRNTAEVHVVVSDANDNSPVFLQPRYDGVLNPDMRNFYERLRVQAYDADGIGPNSDITYEIVNGNYQEKFLIDPKSGEVTLREPLIAGSDAQDHGIPIITLTVRAHDQGVPVRFTTVKVQIHNQEYLNRSISFIVPLTARKASERRQELERGLSALTGAHVNVHSVAFHNISSEKSIVRCWVSYPLSSTVDLTNIDGIISNLFGREYHLSTNRVEAIGRGNFDVVFWLLIALVILMILAILALLFYCCCVRVPDGARDILELKNKIVPEDNVITYRENGAIRGNMEGRRRSNSVTREAWSSTRRSQKLVKRSMSAVDVDVQTSEPQTANAQVSSIDAPPHDVTYRREDAVPREYYHNGHPGGRIERAYRQGRPLSPHTEMMLEDLDGQDVRRVGNYMVVRKVIRPRVHVDHGGGPSELPDDTAPKRTEILYIRSPLREEDDRTFDRVRIGEGEHLRSVSETALNMDEQNMSTLRVPRNFRPPGVNDYRNDSMERSDGPSQQLKFSRYHRTDSDVYLTSDGQVVHGPNEQVPHWAPPGEYARDRPGRQGWPDRWDPEEAYQRLTYNRPAPGESGDYNSIPRNERIRAHQQHQQTLPPQAPPTNIHTHHGHHSHPHYPTELEPHEHDLHNRDSDRVQPHETQQFRHNLPHSQEARQQSEPCLTNHRHTESPETHQDSRHPTRGHFTPQEPETSRAYRRKSSTDAIEVTPEDIEPNQAENENLEDTRPNLERQATEDNLVHGKSRRGTQQSGASEEMPIEEGNGDVVGHETQTEDERPQTVILNSSREKGDDSNRLDDETEIKPDDQDDGTLLRATTEDDLSRTDHLATDLDGEDSDSGIGKDGSGLRLKKANLMEKKSLFTIAYDGMQTRGLKSAGDRDDSP